MPTGAIRPITLTIDIDQGRMFEVLRFRLREAMNLVRLMYRMRYGLVFRRLRREGRDAELRAMIGHMAVEWGQSIFANVHCEVAVEGGEHMPAEGPVVVMANHQNMYDIPLLMAYLGRPMGFVAKRELFRVPGLAYWMRQTGSIALDRRDPEAGRRTFAELGRTLRAEGRGFIIFPEGTRTRDREGRVQAFKPGAIRLATEHDLPVLPVAIDGTRYFGDAEAIRRTRRGGRLVRLRLLPVQHPPAQMSAPERKRFVEDLQTTISSHREAIRVEWPAKGSA